jgi:chromosome segregation ATPase
MNELMNNIENKYLNKILDILNEKDIYELMNFEEKINKMKTENNELNKIISNQKNEIDNLNNKIIDLERNLDYVKMVLDSKKIIINNNNQQIEYNNIEIEKLKEDKNKLIDENKHNLLQKDNEIDNILFTFDSLLKKDKIKFNNYLDKISENNKKKINEIIKNKKREL